MIAAIENANSYLKSRVADNTIADPSPIGFYFAKLWYYERLYPLIFTVSSMSKE